MRVLDCTHVIAGAWCSMLLADLGADVIKIDAPAGEVTRTARAKHLLLTGLPHDADTAERFGLVTGVHAPDDLVPAALACAACIASRAPLAVEATKRVAGRASDLTPQEALQVQAEELGALIQTADHVAAVTAFIEKRAPVFTRK